MPASRARSWAQRRCQRAAWNASGLAFAAARPWRIRSTSAWPAFEVGQPAFELGQPRGQGNIPGAVPSAAAARIALPIRCRPNGRGPSRGGNGSINRARSAGRGLHTARRGGSMAGMGRGRVCRPRVGTPIGGLHRGRNIHPARGPSRRRGGRAGHGHRPGPARWACLTRLCPEPGLLGPPPRRTQRHGRRPGLGQRRIGRHGAELALPQRDPVLGQLVQVGRRGHPFQAVRGDQGSRVVDNSASWRGMTPGRHPVLACAA